MKRSIIVQALFLVGAIPLLAQEAEWTSPFVGYSNTSTLTVDKVEFEKGKTVMHVTAAAPEGTSVKVSSDAYLSADGKQYAIKKVSRLGMDKEYAMPDSGRVHFAMQFEPLPADTRLLHFVEGEAAGGWRLCNIRKDKDDLKTVIPEEWKDVKYAQSEELPESRFSDDSTHLHIQVLNYHAEMREEIRLELMSCDMPVNGYIRTYGISEDGTVAIGLHLYFPTTLSLKFKGCYYDVLALPGEKLSILLDAEKNGDEAAVAFKGKLAATNHELNTLGARRYPPYRYGTAFEDSIGASYPYEANRIYFKKLQDEIRTINGSSYLNSTKAWMRMNAEGLYMRRISVQNSVIAREVKGKLQGMKSIKVDFNAVMTPFYVQVIEEGVLYEIRHSPSFTFAYDYTYYYYNIFKEPEREENLHNREIVWMSRALTAAYQGYSDLVSSDAKYISDPSMKAYLPVALERWNECVEKINTIPNVHYGTEMTKQGSVRESVLKKYAGKHVVFLVYNSFSYEKDMEEFSAIVAGHEKEDVVFAHFHNPLNGLIHWAQKAKTVHGEHYSGIGLIQHSEFSLSSLFEKIPDFYVEIHSPDGTCMLKTDNKEEAFKAIGKLLRQ